LRRQKKNPAGKGAVVGVAIEVVELMMSMERFGKWGGSIHIIGRLRVWGTLLVKWFGAYVKFCRT